MMSGRSGSRRGATAAGSAASGGSRMTDRTTCSRFPLAPVLYPGALMPIHVFEERYRKLMSEHGGDEPIFGVVLTKHGREVGDQPETHEVGAAASLVGKRRYADGR